MAEKKDKKNTFNTRLNEVCGDDDLRPVLQCVQFVNGFAYATNGNITIKQTLEYQSVLNKEMLEGKLLHRDSFKAIMGFEIAECTDMGIECKNANGQTAFFDYYNPPVDQPIPDLERIMKQVRSLTTLSFIGINPEMLNKLTKAMYNPYNNMRIQFTGINSPMLVDAVGIEGQEALLQPIILEASLF